MYAIIDIETTGGNFRTDKITEIAILIHDGAKVTDEFCTLINPERSIPYFITKMTGISNEMVADAPKFYEVAKRIVEITENEIFVAHNASFDYNFVRQEFKNLGYDYNRKMLCTVRLGRKVIPGKKSYSLGNICQDLGISIKNRHRAAGDAMATTKLLEHLLWVDKEKTIFDKELEAKSLGKLNPQLDPAVITDLPEEAGIYYFYNEAGNIIYIGKSSDIRKRVLSHLRSNINKRAMEMRENIASISYELTGSELVALLLESDEIKKHKPLYNRSQRRTLFTYGIYTGPDDHGYTRFYISKIKKDDDPVMVFQSRTEALNYLFKIVEHYQLCQKLCGLYDSKNGCFQYSIGQCMGACVGKELPATYNERAIRYLESLRFQHENFFVIGKGRSEGEYSAIRILNGRYTGFGFFSGEYIGEDPANLADCIKPYGDNRDIQRIMRSYLKRGLAGRVVVG